jgi:hypothetical protein
MNNDNKDNFHQSLDWNTRFALGGEFSTEEIGEMLEQIKEYEETVDMESKYEVAIDDALEKLREFKTGQAASIDEIICILTDI